MPPSTGNDAREPIRVREKVAYGLGDAASNLYWRTFESFLVFFYTDVFGLTARATGTLMLATRIWDAFSDPLVGYLADRTRTRWGRFRPYLLWMCIPLAITGMLTFYTPDLPPGQKLAYAYVTYTAMMLAYTAINIPYGALSGVISPDSTERTSVSTYRFVAAFCGGTVVQFCTLWLVQFFGGVRTVVVDGAVVSITADQQRGFFLTMVCFSIAAVILFVLTFIGTKERVEAVADSKSTFGADLRFALTSISLQHTILIGLAVLTSMAAAFSLEWMPTILGLYVGLSLLSYIASNALRHRWRDRDNDSTFELDFRDLLRNRPWKVLLAYGLLQLTGVFIRGGAILYYFKYYCGDTTIAPFFWGIGSFTAIAGMLLTKPLTKRFGKRRLFIGTNLIVAALTLAFIFLGPTQTTLVLVLHALASFLGGPIPVLLWSMYADTVDYSEWTNGRRATGLTFAAATFSQKIGCAIGAAMTGFALDYFQYVEPVDGINQLQSNETLWGIRMMMSAIPASCLFAATACLCLYNITPEIEQQMETELRQRKLNEPQAHSSPD